MDNGPAASVDVLLSHVLNVSIEAKPDEAGGKDVEGGGGAILDDDD